MYSGQLRDFITVGIPDTAVRESRERIQSALMNSGFGYSTRATINLAPANIRKDLPMTLGILGAMGIVGQAEAPCSAVSCFSMGRSGPGAARCRSPLAHAERA